MLRVLLAAVVFVGIAVLGLGFNIFFRKGGKFPDTEIGSNPAMKKLGIKCAKEEELERLARGKKKSPCGGEYSEACVGCGLYQAEKTK